MQDDKSAIFQMRFPQKLWYLLNLHTDAILWGGTGRTILLNYRVLHNYLQCDHSVFKTTNISSFVRQLNLYGFRKVTSHLQDPLCNSSNPYMHEYVHDYFQLGMPELLNKITRKALTMKKSFKPKSPNSYADQTILTPLQKARRALRLALKKAAQDLFTQHSPNLCTFHLGSSDDGAGYLEGEENIEFDWLTTENAMVEEPSTPANEDPEPEDVRASTIETGSNDNYEDISEESLIVFHGNHCAPSQRDADNFPNQFLSMPDLDDQGPCEDSGVELLAEFNINNDNDEGIDTKKGVRNENDLNSLNCVLPSIGNDPIDDVEKDSDNPNHHYHGEWDQMFNDIISNKSSGPECGSDMKEFYSQISRTIDLLNC
ncbi:uncharacterized protein LOC134648175 [Cydia amplana]|uniref:uncharacterized protein LOC134648175 n=1 Tax=Cydia amplana TaxID=1869771 RepID=UPI002FE614A0